MPKKVLAEFYKRLLNNLTQRPYLKAAQFSKKGLLELLHEIGFRSRIGSILFQERYSCRDVLEVCRPVMESFYPQEPEEGWLCAVYEGIVERLYPSTPPIEEPLDKRRAGLFYLVVLKTFLQQENKTCAFDPMVDFQQATAEEREHSPNGSVYDRFMRVIENEFVIELMRIGREIKPFNTLGHVAGVHHVAVCMARQLVECNVVVDVPLVSAAAATHDIGKFGCKGEEIRRIPYLHYYYTEQWLKRNHFATISHIAANHSTWDLELENLPVESLLLIYADFRVKSSKGADGQEQIHIYTLDESFDVILSKLDHVDSEKRRRYERVYAKLHDFQDYMLALGVDTDPFGPGKPFDKPRRNAALLSAQQAVQGLKFCAIEHNLSLMHKISQDSSFVNMLEAARSEKNWKHLRTYVNIFEEYSSYMTQKQKLLTLRFLYELFMHNQGDIRRQAATLFGRILSQFDVKYRKELPESAKPEPEENTALSLWQEYVELILFPDHKVAPKHRVWINNTFKVVLASLLSNCKKQESEAYLEEVLKRFCQQNRPIAFLLLDVLQPLALSLCKEAALLPPLDFAVDLAQQPERRSQLGALCFAIRLLQRPVTSPACIKAIERVLGAFKGKEDPAICFLLYQAYSLLPNGAERCNAYETMIRAAKINELFLENLKTATPWIVKEVNIQLMLHRLFSQGNHGAAFHVAAHLANLIRVSERVSVRHGAGEALVKIAPLLTLEQCNEISIELVKGLETAEYEFSKYIPNYLGKFMLYLHPKELDELLDEFEKYVKSSNERAACVTLPTLGILLAHYDESYQQRFPEEEAVFQARKERVLGMLLGSLAHYTDAVRQEAFLVYGQQIFGGSLPHKKKLELFQRIHKKLLTLIYEQQRDDLTFFNSAASLNHIYRFIIDAIIQGETLALPEAKQVAFFPGTFDPFSSSHKGIIQEIRNKGLEVYLALDEFSWSKRTQPHMIRRRIMNMSVADVFGVYLFPDDIPINIANPKDLQQLEELFPQREIYIVVGSDVILNASSYQAPPAPHSIHGFHHVVFRRNSADTDWLQEQKIIQSRVSGQILELTLPVYLEDVSSTRIRENIDHNRDISSLVDPVAQSYIYDNGLYLREPQFKAVLRPETLRFQLNPANHIGVREAVMRLALNVQALRSQQEEPARLASRLLNMSQKPGALVMAMHDDTIGVEPIGFCCFYPTSAARLNDEFNDLSMAEYVRRHTSGKIAVISGIYVRMDIGHYDITRLLLTETLANCLKEDFTYAVYPGTGGPQDMRLKGTLERQGFLQLSCSTPEKPVWAVDMRSPIALIEDIQQAIKAPLCDNERVMDVLAIAHKRTAMAMTGLYPGRLVISFHAGILNHALTDMIIKANGVENVPIGVRRLGPYMCVPYGKILKGVVVPNTVTKTLHAEKTYAPDLQSFSITEYPGYAPLIDQIRTIRSFDRPVLLVDDLLHKGYRMAALNPLFTQAELDIRKIIVGILSGRGKDLADEQGRAVESAYYIPNLRYWFVESMLYPFLGGDRVWRNGQGDDYLLPSITQILPYSSPTFITGVAERDLFNLSFTCLQNARDILRVLEEEHQILFERNLTLNRLREAMLWPRVPDKGGRMQYDLGLAPSAYVESDIETLLRMKSSFQ